MKFWLDFEDLNTTGKFVVTPSQQDYLGAKAILLIGRGRELPRR